MSIGQKVLLELKKEIDIVDYEKYINLITYDIENSKNDIAYFIAPNIFIAKWIYTKFNKNIANVFEALSGIRPKIKIDVKEKVLIKDNFINNIDNSQKKVLKSTILNPSFTFESFIVGTSNQFAFTTAKSVAERLGMLYNPLFLYGGVGLGKTHLLQAIGHSQLNLGKRVLYTTLEQFMNKFTSHIKSKNMDSFREHFRECDLLLIDDIQFLSGKDKVQEEFFHTFNELHSNNKQIVMTADRQPNKIIGLVDRLKSRFEWGLMADIQPPKLETKIAIIKKKCELDGINISNEVINYLASNMGSHIREIEGTIIKLNALSSILNQEITLEFTQNAIKDQLDEKKESVTINDIVNFISKERNVKPSDIKSKKRNKVVVEARRIVIYLARHLTPNSMPQIAIYFGMKNHSAISHSIKKINEIINKDENFRVLLEELSNKIGSNKIKID